MTSSVPDSLELPLFIIWLICSDMLGNFFEVLFPVNRNYLNLTVVCGFFVFFPPPFSCSDIYLNIDSPSGINI